MQTGSSAPSAVEEPDGTVALTLPADDASVRGARVFVQQHWSELEADTLDDVALIVAELVSNAVRHGRPEIILRMRRQPFGVDVSVLDHEPRMPPRDVRPADPTATSGRGLFMIDQLAQRWGVEPLADGSGKTVWAAVATG